MARKISILMVAAGLAGAFLIGRGFAGDEPKAPEGGGMEDMAAWEALAKPGPEHAELMKDVGTWTVTSKMWMQPGAPPTESSGKAVFTPALGGRFVRQEFEGELMGQKFLGTGLSGYNNATKKYESVWMDTWGTGILVMNGTVKVPGKSWEYTGSYSGPGARELKSRYVITRVDDNTTTMEMWNDIGQGEMKAMELTYTRQK